VEGHSASVGQKARKRKRVQGYGLCGRKRENATTGRENLRPKHNVHTSWGGGKRSEDRRPFLSPS